MEHKQPSRRWVVAASLVVAAGAVAVSCFAVYGGRAWLQSLRPAGAGGVFDGAASAESRGRAEQIAAALERYRGDRGVYPASLDELVPAYMKQIPLPTAGSGKWTFWVNRERTRYEIKFGDGDPPYPCQYFDGARWGVDG